MTSERDRGRIFDLRLVKFNQTTNARLQLHAKDKETKTGLINFFSSSTTFLKFVSANWFGQRILTV